MNSLKMEVLFKACGVNGEWCEVCTLIIPPIIEIEPVLSGWISYVTKGLRL